MVGHSILCLNIVVRVDCTSSAAAKHNPSFVEVALNQARLPPPPVALPFFRPDASALPGLLEVL